MNLYFTFHNVSINTNRDIAKDLDNITLHSTMFLLIPILTKVFNRLGSLYIPQCFY